VGALRRLKYKVEKFLKFLERPLRVRCYDCGFLACDNDEVGTARRELLGLTGTGSATQASEEYVNALHCHRSQWPGYGPFANCPLDELNARRRCKEFRRHRPGFSPDDHRKSLSDSEQRRAQFRYTVAAAILGAILALIGQSVVVTGQQWIAKHFGLPISSGTVSDKK
jgi:hypothetical protein